jgi:hypothetical protein
MRSPDRRRLGEILVARGALSEEQLALVLAEHERTRRPVGELVVALGVASSVAVNAALAEQRGWTEVEPGAIDAAQAEVPTVPTAQQPTIQGHPPAARPEGSVHDTDSSARETPRLLMMPPPASFEGSTQTSGRGAAELPPVPVAQPAEADSTNGHQPADGTAVEQQQQGNTSRHLLLVPTAAGYQLLERDGDAPPPGATVNLPNGDSDVPYLVLKTTRTPLPGSSLRRCAYLHAV